LGRLDTLLLCLPTWRPNAAPTLLPAVSRFEDAGLQIIAAVVEVAFPKGSEPVPALRPDEVSELIAGLAGRGAAVYRIGAKMALAIAMLGALGAFLSSARYATSVDDARAGLASLFLWVQVIHGFDLPRRRDLSFSLAASTALMAEAGSLSLSSTYLLFLVPYAMLGATWLWLSSRPSSMSARVSGRVVGRSRSSAV